MYVNMKINISLLSRMQLVGDVPRYNSWRRWNSRLYKGGRARGDLLLVVCWFWRRGKGLVAASKMALWWLSHPGQGSQGSIPGAAKLSKVKTYWEGRSSCIGQRTSSFIYVCSVWTMTVDVRVADWPSFGARLLFAVRIQENVCYVQVAPTFSDLRCSVQDCVFDLLHGVVLTRLTCLKLVRLRSRKGAKC